MKNAKMLMWRMTMAAALPVLFAGPVQAGFEWSPPPAAPALSSAAPASSDSLPPISASPAAAVEATELMPIPGTDAAMPADMMPPAMPQTAIPETAMPSAPSSAPSSAMPHAMTDPAISAPVIERESTALPQPTMQERLSPPPATGPFAVAQGFGADIPLALALGQIVPPEYAYSFASSVNPGLKISWDGGKPWNIVLNDALAVHGLRADIAGTAVVVRKARAADNASINNDASPMAGSMVAPVLTSSSAEPASSSMMAEPLDMQSSGGHNTAPRPPMDAPISMSASAPVVPAAAGGEGSANYPRRSAKEQGFFKGIFTPEDKKGNQAPRPPITIRNEVPAEELSALSAPAQVAAVEPAAPAMAAMPMAVSSESLGGPVPLNAAAMPQKISYADEEMRQRTDIMPERDRAVSASAPVSTSGQENILDPFQVSFWQADNNASLRDVLSNWAQQAGVEMIWDSGYDYKLPGSVALHGTFPEAVTRVFDMYGKAEPRPQGKLHPNLPKGPSVLLVENYP